MTRLRSLEVGSFKAFDSAQTLPLRPLTLLFGPNSAGKSSAIHALAYLHEAVASRSLDVRHPRVGGTAVDLGGFPNFIHRRAVAGRCEFALEFAGQSLPHSFARLIVNKPESVKVMFTVGGVSFEKGQLSLPELPGVGQGRDVALTSLRLDVDGQVSLRLSRRPDRSLRVDSLGHQWDLGRALEMAERKALGPSEHEAMWAFVDRNVAYLRVLGEGLCPNEVQVDERAGAASKDDRTSRFKDGLIHLMRAIVDEIGKLVQGEFHNFKYLGPLRAYPARHVYEATPEDPDWFAGGAYAWHLVAQDEVLREKINRWLGQEALRTRYELVVQTYAELEAMRQPMRDHLEAIEEEYSADAASMVDDDSVAGSDSNWDVDRMLAAVRTSGAALLTTVGLRDLRTRTLVSHRDVGIGISQVLPVLAAAYSARQNLVAIEQPELHLHPALQAELADVFIESALTQGNTFLLETHSEHLLLRIARRMRETARGTIKDHPVRPEDVCVLVIESPEGLGGPIVRELRMKPDGKFIDPWPDGFFEEEFNELFA